MKSLIAVCTLVVLCLINSSEADKSDDCSADSWTAVETMDLDRILGRWFVILRFTNGEKNPSACMWQDLTAHPTIPNAIQDSVHHLYKTGKSSHRREKFGGALTSTNRGKSQNQKKKSEGIYQVEYKRGVVVDKYITALNYDEFTTTRACVGGEEHFWVYSRNQYPLNSTLIKIKEEIGAQGIDTSKLIESCSSVSASHIV